MQDEISISIDPKMLKVIEIGKDMAGKAIEMSALANIPESLQRQFCDALNTMIGAAVSGINRDAVGIYIERKPFPEEVAEIRRKMAEYAK